ncbi:MAG: hypothetical protein E4G99_09750 [Anaerolineales bacterium]|nr:MAG: hypothetical protein E4G99_09750 [Anaerolineales bacterium]
MRFEKKHQGLLSRRRFFFRMTRHFLLATGIVAFSLGIGMLGYGYFEGMNSLDALLNAAMILGGMGPVSPLQTAGGKIFASVYALLSGLIFLGLAGVLFAPLVHRLLHRFHLDDEQ